MNIILASASPRRKEILTDMGYEFKIIVSDANENITEADPCILTEKLAKLKADAVSDKADENDIIISADTVVAIDDRILGKPKDKSDAENMISALSGNVHRVITGVCVKTANKEFIAHDITYVYFKKLTAQQIEDYVSTDEPYDKAGGYAIQGLAGKFVDKIEGSYTNVVGLPKELLQKMLNKLI